MLPRAGPWCADGGCGAPAWSGWQPGPGSIAELGWLVHLRCLCQSYRVPTRQRPEGFYEKPRTETLLVRDWSPCNAGTAGIVTCPGVVSCPSSSPTRLSLPQLSPAQARSPSPSSTARPRSSARGCRLGRGNHRPRSRGSRSRARSVAAFRSWPGRHHRAVEPTSLVEVGLTTCSRYERTKPGH
jgi:hypothetical protein